MLGVLLLSLVAVGLVVTGPVADAIGSAIGLGDTAVAVWSVAKWPVMLLIVMTVIASLYYIAPNVRHPKFRWITPGGILAVLVWAIASVGFGFYVSQSDSYNSTYGTLGGVISFLVWMWLSNLALLLGAEFDSELERERELKPGCRPSASCGCRRVSRRRPPAAPEASATTASQLSARVWDSNPHAPRGKGF